MSKMDEYLKQEDAFQETFSNIETNFEPKKLLCVNLVRSRDVSVSCIEDILFELKPHVQITCPNLPTPNSFKTNVEKHTSTRDINETFKFVLPQVMPRPCPVEVELLVGNSLIARDLGKEIFDASEFEEEVSYQKTLCLSSTSCCEMLRFYHGEVDLEIKIKSRQRPDFRLSLGLSDEERAFRKRRIDVVHDSLSRLIPEGAPNNISETPVISLCTSGGGYRAIVGTVGAMEALKDAGLLNIFTYAAGLSGSAWYLASAYTRQGYKAEKQEEFHEFLGEAVQENFWLKSISPFNLVDFRNYLWKTKLKYGQPTSAVDFFGYTAGSVFLGEDNIETRLSGWREYVEDGSVPYPLIVDLHVKNNALASKFHAYVECSPHEIALPEYGIGIKPETFGSVWSSGFMVRKCSEYPIHFHQGVTGSAAGILAATDIDTGEKDEHFLRYIDQVKALSKECRFGECDDDHDSIDEQYDEEDNDGKPLLKNPGSAELSYTTSARAPALPEEPEEAEEKENNDEEITLKTRLKDALLTSRDSVFGRTGKAFNFSLNFQSLKSYQLDPFGGTEFVGPDKEALLKIFGSEKKSKMSTTNPVISLMDPGLYLNVPTDILLRPQRTNDLLIVMDFSAYESDSKFDYLPLLTAAANAWSDGLKFPPIDFRRITNLPPKECLVFEDENDLECPIVVWFTLCNKTFRNLKDYKPRNPKYESMKDFNKFPVFDQDTVYTLFNWHYDSLTFERLRELVYHNVTSNIHEVKNAIEKAIERKKRRLSGSGL